MKLSELTALSPIDGRYYSRLSNLSHYFSEYALIKYRVYIEVKWLIHLSQEEGINELPPLSDKVTKLLESLLNDFSEKDAEAVKAIEAVTNHDVKAVEYFLKQRLEKSLKNQVAFLHFGATSADINNLAYASILKDVRANLLIPELRALTNRIKQFALSHKGISMLARTHGQPATPTTLGKEFAVFALRLTEATDLLEKTPISGKFNGATGGYNAHLAAYPNIDWFDVGRRFVESLGITFNPLTTQIEPHDTLAANFDAIARANSILIGFAQDAWQYISLDYLKLKKADDEVGSSTMPHKVNPIHFENAEGNLGVANALLKHLAEKLPRSRMQRDLSDSTVMRNIGTAIAYSKLSYNSLERGLNLITANVDAIRADLEGRWELLSEPVQTVLRRHGITDAYEQLKNLTRGQAITESDLKGYIESLKIPEEAKASLLSLTPLNYTGLSETITELVLAEID